MKKALFPTIAFAIICILGNSINTYSKIKTDEKLNLNSHLGNDLYNSRTILVEDNMNSSEFTRDTLILRSVNFNPWVFKDTLLLNGRQLQSGSKNPILILPDSTVRIVVLDSGIYSTELTFTWTGYKLKFIPSVNWSQKDNDFIYIDSTDQNKHIKLQVNVPDTGGQIGILIVGTTFPVIQPDESAEAGLPRRK